VKQGIPGPDRSWISASRQTVLFHPAEVHLDRLLVHVHSRPERIAEDFKLADFYEPVKDVTAPTPQQIVRAVQFIRCALADDKPVAVCCGYGFGRSATVFACYLVSLGHSAEDAIQQLIAVRTQARELLLVPGQKEAVEAYWRQLK
jgi:atypical dual specificity phosphatase